MPWRECLFFSWTALLVVSCGQVRGQQAEAPAAEPPAAEAPPETQSESEPEAGPETPTEPEAPADEPQPPETADLPAEPKSEQPQDGQASEGSQPERPQVAWDEKIAEVLGKRYPQNLEDLKLIQTQTKRVIDYAMPAVVAVQVGGAFGTAVIVSPDGFALTAGHVVGRPGQPVTFIFADGKTARGKTLGMYREIDSGMMQITDPGPWPYVDMAKSEGLETGEWVVAIGQPGGFDRDRTPPVRLGRVLFANQDVISTDCTLVGGDSGGPLFNMHGQVVGIHSRIGRRITDNFHVPISTYHTTWDRLAAGELWALRSAPRKFRQFVRCWAWPPIPQPRVAN